MIAIAEMLEYTCLRVSWIEKTISFWKQNCFIII